MKLFNPTDVNIQGFVFKDQHGSRTLSLLSEETKDFGDAEGEALLNIYGFLEKIEDSIESPSNVVEVEQRKDGTVQIGDNIYRVKIHPLILAKYKADAVADIKKKLTALQEKIEKRRETEAKQEVEPAPAKDMRVNKPTPTKTTTKKKLKEEEVRGIDIPKGVDKDGVEWVGNGVEKDVI